ncbi:MAG: fluoride efflux transporter CrcB [Acidobacteria bacterium]|nr:MAG: fluoride efflux transporter CrcB [Acidobacteriota bacterium]
MNKILFIGVAGLLGTLGRYWLSGWADERWGASFPIGTLIVNLVGCLLIGFLFHATEEKYLVDPVLRSAVLIGFLGGFTTFSSFGVQTFNLLRDGEIFLAGVNVLVSNVAGLLLVWIGYAVSKSL